MAREEQIYKKAEGDCIAMIESIERGDIIKGSICPQSYRAGFMDGAKWADQHPDWIPVEERKPPIAYHDDLSENDLVVDSDGELLIAYYDAKNKLWFSVDSNPRIYDVTHWMEIHPPRKEE